MADPEATERAKALWASGHYAEVAAHFSSAAEKALAAGRVSSRDRVLDVACGTGNATLPAARTGASVTGLDFTPELLDQARAAAAEEGLEIEFVEGDAGAMPFEDASFDSVISVFGCMFVPDHGQAAAELARVLAPEGRLAVLAWTPSGLHGRMFATCAARLPAPPEGSQPPILWGEEDHVREIFSGTGVELSFERDSLVSPFDSFDASIDWLENDIPPVAAAKALLEPQDEWDALRADLVALYEETAERGEDGSVSFDAEYLVIKATKA